MSWAESTGIERQRIKVSRHLFLTEVTYVCHHLITVFKGCMIQHNQMLWTKLGKNFAICVNLAKTLARTIRTQPDAQHWLLFRAS